MKNKHIKKVFDQIKPDEAKKKRILNNIYNETRENKEYKSNIFKGRYIMIKKLIPALAVALILVLVGGSYWYYGKTNNSNMISPPTSLPPVGEEYIPDKEFNNFNLQKLKENTAKIEIRNHTNSNTFKEITDKEFINASLNSLENIKIKYENIDDEKVKEKAYKFLESVAHSQALGNSITLSFITKDNVASSIRVNLDLDAVCINEEYYDVSSNFIKNIEKQLKNINLNEVNLPGQN